MVTGGNSPPPGLGGTGGGGAGAGGAAGGTAVVAAPMGQNVVQQRNKKKQVILNFTRVNVRYKPQAWCRRQGMERITNHIERKYNNATKKRRHLYLDASIIGIVQAKWCRPCRTSCSNGVRRTR